MISQEQIMEWVRHPDLMDKESLYELRKVVNAYPYYQLARILFLKNLYLLNMPEFKTELKKGVLYVADASLLFYYLEGDKFAIVQHNDETEGNRYSEPDRTLALIDDFLKDDDASRAADMKLVPEAPVDYTSLLMKDDAMTDENTPQLRGQSLIDDFLKQAEDDSRPLYRFEPEGMGDECEQQADTSAEPAMSHQQEETKEHVEKTQVLSQEIEGSDELSDDDETDDAVLSDAAEDSSLSETLAKIYVKQQKYEKALEIIKKLNLKYPKKNAYFADQIRFLEKLIINTKSK